MKSFIKTIVFSLVLAAGIVSMTVNADAKDAEGNVVIVIDPGHGGEDPGAHAVTGAFEDECNYIIAMAMKNELCKYDGVKVYLTREADSWITNTGRAMIAAGLKADFLISLHNNIQSISRPLLSGNELLHFVEPYKLKINFAHTLARRP